MLGIKYTIRPIVSKDLYFTTPAPTNIPQETTMKLKHNTLKHLILSVCLLITLQSANAYIKYFFDGIKLLEAGKIFGQGIKLSAPGLQSWSFGAGTIEEITTLRSRLAHFNEKGGVGLQLKNSVSSQDEPDDEDEITFSSGSGKIRACNIPGCKVSPENQQANMNLLISTIENNMRVKYSEALKANTPIEALNTVAAAGLVEAKYVDSLKVHLKTVNKIEGGWKRFYDDGIAEVISGHPLTVIFKSMQLITGGKLEDQYETIVDDLKTYAQNTATNSERPDTYSASLIKAATPTTIVNSQITKLLNSIEPATDYSTKDAITKKTLADVAIQLGKYELSTDNKTALETKLNLRQIGMIEGNEITLKRDAILSITPKLKSDTLEISQAGMTKSDIYSIASNDNSSEITIPLKTPITQGVINIKLYNSHLICVVNDPDTNAPQAVGMFSTDNYNTSADDNDTTWYNPTTWPTGAKIGGGTVVAISAVIIGYKLDKWLFSDALAVNQIQNFDENDNVQGQGLGGVGGANRPDKPGGNKLECKVDGEQLNANEKKDLEKLLQRRGEMKWQNPGLKLEAMGLEAARQQRLRELQEKLEQDWQEQLVADQKEQERQRQQQQLADQLEQDRLYKQQVAQWKQQEIDRRALEAQQKKANEDESFRRAREWWRNNQ